MKLIDFLEQFTPAKFDWNKANEAWDEICIKHNIKDEGIGTGDWIEAAPRLTDLLNLIKAGAFEDCPRKIILTRTFTYEEKMRFPCCFTNSPGTMIGSEVYDPPIEMKPATVDKSGLLKDIDNRIFNLECVELAVKSSGDRRMMRDCNERLEELKMMRVIIETERFNTQRIGENSYGMDE